MADQNQFNSYQQSSYDQVPQAGNPTYSEAWALVEAARRMAGPLEYGSLDEPENLSTLRDGLRLNWRLWTIFQTELSLEDGPVPTGIRENMLNLCNFVDKHTVETINEPTAERVSILIEINRQIANGLILSLQDPTEEQERGENQNPSLDKGAEQKPPFTIDTDV